MKTLKNNLIAVTFAMFAAIAVVCPASAKESGKANVKQAQTETTSVPLGFLLEINGVRVPYEIKTSSKEEIMGFLMTPVFPDAIDRDELQFLLDATRLDDEFLLPGELGFLLEISGLIDQRLTSEDLGFLMIITGLDKNPMSAQRLGFLMGGK